MGPVHVPANQPMTVTIATSVVDAQGLTTEVAIFDIVTGLHLNPKLFWIDDNLLIDMDER